MFLMGAFALFLRHRKQAMRASNFLPLATRVAWRRATQGPLQPSWSFTLEFVIEAIRHQMGGRQLSEEVLPKARKVMSRVFDPLPRGMSWAPAQIKNIPVEWVFSQSKSDYGRHLHRDGVILYLHGGAYIGMSPATHRAIIARLVRDSGATAVAVDYRLAPENPFPAAICDALEVYKHLVSPVSEGGLGVPASKIVFAGDSAGGGLSVASAMALGYARRGDPMLKGLGLPIPVYPAPTLPSPAGVAVISPWVDIDCQGPTWTSNARFDYLVSNELVSKWYCGKHLAHHPLVSPVHGDFSGFPPLTIHVGGVETLLSEAELMSERARAAGAEVELVVWPEMPHVFHMFSALIPQARVATSGLAAAIHRHLNKPLQEPVAFHTPATEETGKEGKESKVASAAAGSGAPAAPTTTASSEDRARAKM